MRLCSSKKVTRSEVHPQGPWSLLLRQRYIFFFLVKSQCSILDLMIFTIFLKVQDPSPPANKQILEKPAKMSSPQRSDKSPPPTVGKRKSSDKPKRSLQIQLEKLAEPFQEKVSEPLPKPTPKSSSLDADQKLEESKVILNFFEKKSFRNNIFEYFRQIFSVLPLFLLKHVLKKLIFFSG